MVFLLGDEKLIEQQLETLLGIDRVDLVNCAGELIEDVIEERDQQLVLRVVAVDRGGRLPYSLAIRLIVRFAYPCSQSAWYVARMISSAGSEPTCPSDTPSITYRNPGVSDNCFPGARPAADRGSVRR